MLLINFSRDSSELRGHATRVWNACTDDGNTWCSSQMNLCSAGFILWYIRLDLYFPVVLPDCAVSCKPSLQKKNKDHFSLHIQYHDYWKPRYVMGAGHQQPWYWHNFPPGLCCLKQQKDPLVFIIYFSYTLSCEYRVVRNWYSQLLFTSEDRVCANLRVQEQSTNMTSQCQCLAFARSHKSTVIRHNINSEKTVISVTGKWAVDDCL